MKDKKNKTNSAKDSQEQSNTSFYRLGDLFDGFLDSPAIEKLLHHHPDSIGSKFYKEIQDNPNFNKLEIMSRIALDYANANLDQLPIDISRSIVVHLRLGDVMAGYTLHERRKRPLDLEYINSLISEYVEKTYVIGKPYFAVTSSKNYEECYRLSNEYLQTSIQVLNAKHFDSDDADLDLCCGLKSKIFVQGRGRYSNLIVKIRKKLKLCCIEVDSHLDI
jgi:hypothetical protein